jgi:Fe-S oxidoreductase
MKLASTFSAAYNFVFGNTTLRKVANRSIGFHPDRSIPSVGRTTLKRWFKHRKKNVTGTGRSLYFFCDEFTNYLDVEIGKKAVLLLESLGYNVFIPNHVESGRSFLSKGFVKQAAQIANKNISLLSRVVDEGTPIVGIEPSSILTLRDEYIDLADQQLREKAKHLAKNTFTIEEFIANEEGKGNITKDSFTKEKCTVALHGHCYQKVLSSQHYSSAMLSLPENYTVQVIPSGCCGMAGSFGYEAEHYEVSQQIGELVLFPTLRKLKQDVLIAAAGTSCRHQIKDGTQRTALHPVEILWEALNRK